MTALSVYLAGPMVFFPDSEAVFSRMKELCQRHGLVGVSPLDNQIGLEGMRPDRSLLERIVTADIELMDALDGGVFCLDPFRRSPEMDPGTAFEIGYMRALRKPIAGWTRDPRHYPAKVEDYFAFTFGQPLLAAAAGLKGGTSGTTRDPDGVLVHSQTCAQNAMIDLGIITAGGRIFVDPNWETAFDLAIAHLAARLGVSAIV
jgi:nucleoside 2-deoxyribosyltransferase